MYISRHSVPFLTYNICTSWTEIFHVIHPPWLEVSAYIIILLPALAAFIYFQIWREYDTDGSGYIEADELKNFLRDLLKEAKKINDVSEDKLIEYTDTMVK